MAKDQVIAINDAVHKLQLAMLEGITDQKQLFAAGNLISKSDYEDVVTERTIAKLCGYPLCRRYLASEVSRRGKYRISLKEHKVYDIQETRKFCSAGCLIDSKAFSGTLQEARTSEFDTVKLNEILGLFGDLDEKDSLSVNEDLGLSKLTIRENVEVRGGDLSLEQWMGPSNAVEGYVPIDRSNCKSRNGKNDSKATQSKQEKKHEDSPFSEMDFTSTVIFPDEYSVSKLPLQTKQASPVKESEDDEGKTVVREQTVVPPTKKKSRFLREREKEKRKNFGFDGIDLASFGFDEMGCASSVTTNDGYNVEYSVSKQPPCSMEDPLSCHLQGLQALDGKNALLGSSSGSNTKGSRTKQENFGKIVSIEYHANSCEDTDKILTTETYKGLKPQDGCSSSKTIMKSCLKISGSKKINRSVTWADKNDGCGDLCEVRSNDITSGVNLSSTKTEDVNSVSRLALAEACAKALSQAAEAVSSGGSDASDAAAKAGIVLVPSTHQLDEEVTEEHIEEEMTEEEPTLLKWPNKPGIPDSDLFDRDESWVDGPPEGFNLTLSSFAVMWDLLFGWVSSSSLAYIYGKDESVHEEFLSVNGKKYPRRIIMGDWLSSEIKETVAGSLARALPRVATDIRLPVAISELEKGLGSLLETMSLTGAVPSFRVEQWLVIVLLFLEALSVSRIPRIAPSISNRNKILEGSGIDLTPAVLAEEASKLASMYSDVMTANILNEEQCKELKMGSYLAVAAASANPPFFIHLVYKPSSGPVKTKLALVGKGLTFDSGGYNIKTGPGCSIELMKFDMGGSAAVLGAAKAIGQIKPPGVEVHFIVAACENMISGTGMRPGDVITASNGKTIEVNNTDAEGRLTLADALVYACNQGVDKIVDLATLTGACVVALGTSMAGIYTPNDGLAKEVIAASERSGEKLWRMPMEESYWEMMKSGVADMVNTGGRAGGSITAALFLKQFVNDKVEWMHIDMAGPVWSEKKKAATGFGVATLVEWVQNSSSS